MRLWYGKEKEGPDVGKVTLFVENSTLYYENLQVVKEVLLHHKIKRVYFGAGRLDSFISKDNYKYFNNFIQFCLSSGIKPIMEISLDGFKKLNQEIKSMIHLIIRVDIPDLDLLEGDLIKFDTYDNVYVTDVRDMMLTSLKDLQGNKFINDTEIYIGGNDI